jgi:hypothetical protein
MLNRQLSGHSMAGEAAQIVIRASASLVPQRDRLLVEIAERTSDRLIQQASFKGMLEAKLAKNVTVETTALPPSQ